MSMFSKNYLSPIGRIEIISNNDSILSISFVKSRKNSFKKSHTLCDRAQRKLEKYFEGKLKHFDLPIELSGTDFQNKVWKALCNIPYGETRTYQEIAIQIGNKNSCRAVGGANNKNPLGIIVPCHRVVGKNGDLVGYAAGLKSKEKLLRLENQHC
jgi:methylated-DNA-[protein]-cysteine S-methyltransferase